MERELADNGYDSLEVSLIVRKVDGDVAFFDDEMQFIMETVAFDYESEIKIGAKRRFAAVTIPLLETFAWQKMSDQDFRAVSERWNKDKEKTDARPENPNPEGNEAGDVRG